MYLIVERLIDFYMVDSSMQLKVLEWFDFRNEQIYHVTTTAYKQYSQSINQASQSKLR